MLILLSEFVCGGSWPAATIPASLAREGRAMWEAVIRDLLAIPKFQVFTTWDKRLGSPPAFLPANSRLHLAVVDSPQHEQELLLEFRRLADCALIIAPELENTLAARCGQLREGGLTLCNASNEALGLCSDKLQLCQFLERQSIPTISTRPVSRDWNDGPCVVKRRDGAGSFEMRSIALPAELNEFLSRPRDGEYVQQPLIPGRSLSVAALCDHGRLTCLLPIVEQLLSGDGSFSYLGGRMPARHVDAGKIADLVRTTVQHVPGLHGYIGFDLLIPDRSPDDVLVVEINPRLTTSYLGYRQLCQENLGARLVNPDGDRPLKFSGAVQFAADGTILENAK